MHLVFLAWDMMVAVLPMAAHQMWVKHLLQLPEASAACDTALTDKCTGALLSKNRFNVYCNPHVGFFFQTAQISSSACANPVTIVLLID